MNTSILDSIIDDNREPFRRRMREYSLSSLTGFSLYERERMSMADALRADGVSIIAEIKHRSPSKGILREDFQPVEIARQYEDAGASALSVLTEQFHFGGDLKYLESVREVVDLPLLRKDFLFDPYHVFEARAYGADAVLLIAEALSDGQLDELLAATHEAGLHALVELHDAENLQRIDFDRAHMVGVNNRDLRTFEVDIRHATRVLQAVPPSVVRVAESGIRTPDDLLLIEEHDIDAALIGEAFMVADRPGDELCRLLEHYERLRTESEYD
jgi:indole-3-glycerol phosphate synthase